jgi:MFS transporter
MSAGCAVALAENAPGCRSRRSGSSACGTSRSPTSSACYRPRRRSPASSSRALYLKLVLGYSPLEVALAFLPGNLVTMAFSIGISARLVMRFGLRLPLAAGLGVAALGLLFFARAPVDGNSVVDVLPSMILLGRGAGIAFNPVLLAAMGDVKPSDAARASGVVNTSFMMGGAGALGLAVLASVAASRTENLGASGDGPLAALTGGYHAAFLIGALFAAGAASSAASSSGRRTCRRTSSRKRSECRPSQRPTVERGRDEFSALRGSTEVEMVSYSRSSTLMPALDELVCAVRAVVDPARRLGAERPGSERRRSRGTCPRPRSSRTSTNGSSLRRYYDHPVVCH